MFPIPPRGSSDTWNVPVEAPISEAEGLVWATGIQSGQFSPGRLTLLFDTPDQPTPWSDPDLVEGIMGWPATSENGSPTFPIISRLVLEDIGRPLWEYENDEEFLRGLRSAVQVHQELWKRNTLHGDISPGNVHLCKKGADTSRAGIWVYLMDFDYASSKTPKITVIEQASAKQGVGEQLPLLHTGGHMRFDGKSKVERRAEMSGNAQFFAAEVLRALAQNKQDVRANRL
ncbi:hypothetical protein D9613_012224 [Agrocybe pediades]|uniref:Fungal-type protein kinase domain-containing protein n=1 Tax=Agrocybe pediades TaxID=84607 RepID=A0A8H4QET3_9AGAR|nr:hypothetical protein D9613_012224 [Agrocybe pediades]